jgi:hypothetical protein
VTVATNSAPVASTEDALIRFLDARALLRHDATEDTRWHAADPLNCAGCALAIELAEQDCQRPGHRHTAACWDDRRCPDHVGGAP